ncbi:MAG: hypothetical protein CL424_05210 [Acidimicrobiaceae bacterium]|nr:hypothetical protein [Acidimicrobiaceae bacterium]
MAGRVDATEPITPALVAATSGVDRQLADVCFRSWIDAVADRCRAGYVVVFDELVIGPNEPILLEGWHATRTAALADERGLFDDDEEQWYDLHAELCGDDCDHVYERLTVAEWALVGLQLGWCGDRFVDGSRLVAQATRHLETERWLDVVRIVMAIERLLTELADAITVDGFPVLDARPRHRRIDRLRWAA